MKAWPDKMGFALVLGLITIMIISGCTTPAPAGGDGGTGDYTDTGSQQNDSGSHGSGMNKVVLASGEWAPYVSENLLHEGVVSRIVSEAFALEGVEVEYAYLPWARSMEAAKKGEYHGTLPWLKNDEREADFYFPDSIATENVMFFHKKTLNFTWDTVSDLVGYKIGGTTGYFYGDDFEAAENNGNITIERATEDEMNFQKLLADRVDVIIAEVDVGYDIMERVFTAEEYASITHYEGKSISTSPLYLLLSKQVDGNDQFIESFNKGLARLEESGKVEQYWEESRLGDYKI